MFKKIIRKIYEASRKHIFGGRGLSKYRFLRNVNFAFEKFIKGKHQEFITYNGLKFYLDPRDSLRSYDKEEVYERHATQLMEAILKNGDVFVDVGASIGWFTLNGSNKVGKNGRVYSFEPNPLSFNLLKKNLQVNHCDNVTAEHLAVTDRSGKSSLFVVGDIWYGSTLFDPRENSKDFIDAHFADNEDKEVREYPISAISLDDYFKDKKIDFMKIDAEGSEGKIFEGMKGVIENNPNLVIIAEFSPTALRGAGTNPDQFLASLRQKGFLVYELGVKEHPIPLKTTPKGGVNLLFTKRDLSAVFLGMI